MAERRECNELLLSPELGCRLRGCRPFFISTCIRKSLLVPGSVFSAPTSGSICTKSRCGCTISVRCWLPVLPEVALPLSSLLPGSSALGELCLGELWKPAAPAPMPIPYSDFCAEAKPLQKAMYFKFSIPEELHINEDAFINPARNKHQNKTLKQLNLFPKSENPKKPKFEAFVVCSLGLFYKKLLLRSSFHKKRNKIMSILYKLKNFS